MHGLIKTMKIKFKKVTPPIYVCHTRSIQSCEITAEIVLWRILQNVLLRFDVYSAGCLEIYIEDFYVRCPVELQYANFSTKCNFVLLRVQCGIYVCINV